MSDNANSSPPAVGGEGQRLPQDLLQEFDALVELGPPGSVREFVERLIAQAGSRDPRWQEQPLGALEAFSDLEMALYGKIGNTWEVTHAQRIQAVLNRVYAKGLAEAEAREAAIRALVEKWREEARLNFQAHDLSHNYVAGQLEACADQLEAALR